MAVAAERDVVDASDVSARTRSIELRRRAHVAELPAPVVGGAAVATGVPGGHRGMRLPRRRGVRGRGVSSTRIVLRALRTLYSDGRASDDAHAGDALAVDRGGLLELTPATGR